MTKQDYCVIALVFLGGFLAIVAGAGEDTVPPLIKLVAAATAAGIGAVLALLKPPGSGVRTVPTDPPQAVKRDEGRG